MSKNYNVTVNGNTYAVTVEEVGAGAPVVTAPPRPVASPAAPTPAPAPKAPAAAPAASGRVRIEAGAAGKVCKINAAVGTAVKRGDAVVTVEAMKMEIPVVAPEDGTVAAVVVSVGDAVEAGALLATLN